MPSLESRLPAQPVEEKTEICFEKVPHEHGLSVKGPNSLAITYSYNPDSIIRRLRLG
jgi:hypothetical protein